MTIALLVTSVSWLILSAWVVVDRIAYDRLVASVRRGGRLHRLRWRTLARLAADSSSEPELADALARSVLATDERRIVLAALDVDSGWRGVQAVRILVRSGHPEALPALERMLASGDEDVRAATLTILGDVQDERATTLLVEALRTGVCPPNWGSALLDSRPISKSMLLPLLGDETPAVRAVGTRLLARVGTPDREVDDILLGLCRDDEADVRAAACAALAERGTPRAARRISTLLRDREWFVQVRAARALGCLHAVTSAGAVAELLQSPSWWVRQAAKDALVDLGPDVRDQLVPWLDHHDAFARNSCAEVLVNLGIVDDLLAEVTHGNDPERVEAAASLLRKILVAGGARVADALNEASGATIQATLGSAGKPKSRAA